MKVEAQYEVLGTYAKRDVRPGRDDRSVLAPSPLVCSFTSARSRRSSRPGRIFFLTPPQHFVLGYFRWIPPGLIASTLEHLPKPAKKSTDVLGQKFRLFCGCEVTSAGHIGPLLNIVTPLDPRTRRK